MCLPVIPLFVEDTRSTASPVFLTARSSLLYPHITNNKRTYLIRGIIYNYEVYITNIKKYRVTRRGVVRHGGVRVYRLTYTMSTHVHVVGG